MLLHSNAEIDQHMHAYTNTPTAYLHHLDGRLIELVKHGPEGMGRQSQDGGVSLGSGRHTAKCAWVALSSRKCVDCSC